MTTNISISTMYTELEKMSPLERTQLLAKTNPLREMARKKKEEAWQKIREYVDERIRQERDDYAEEYGENYVKALRDDKVSRVIVETDEFDKLMDDYFEWSI